MSTLHEDYRKLYELMELMRGHCIRWDFPYLASLSKDCFASVQKPPDASCDICETVADLRRNWQAQVEAQNKELLELEKERDGLRKRLEELEGLIKSNPYRGGASRPPAPSKRPKPSSPCDTCTQYGPGCDDCDYAGTTRLCAKCCMPDCQHKSNRVVKCAIYQPRDERSALPVEKPAGEQVKKNCELCNRKRECTVAGKCVLGLNSCTNCANYGDNSKCLSQHWVRSWNPECWVAPSNPKDLLVKEPAEDDLP